MRLIYLPANGCWVFTWGNGQITSMGDYGTFFPARSSAVLAALEQGLTVKGNGEVEAIEQKAQVVA